MEQAMIATCGQLEAKTIDTAADVWPVVHHLAEKAAAASADLLVLPETAYPAYWLESAERYRRDDIERSEAVLARYAALAAKHAFWLVAGYVEEADDRLYNAAAVFDRAGNRVAGARKQFMWDCDRKWFTPGNGSTVVETEFGRMGVQICADVRMPEITATLVAGGAAFIAVPTAWVNVSDIPRTYRNIQPEFLIRARALEFRLPFVCCSKSGRENPTLEYVGQSQIVTADGKTAARAPLSGDELAVAEITPARPPALSIDPDRIERLESPEPPFSADAVEQRCTIHPRQDAEAITSQLQQAGVRVERIDTADLASFALARCHALDGIQVLLATGRIIEDATARARAAENGMFVIITAGSEARCVIDPGGTIVWRQVDSGNTLELDVGRANAKAFTPTTDIWSQRHVSTYKLQGP